MPIEVVCRGKPNRNHIDHYCDRYGVDRASVAMRDERSDVQGRGPIHCKNLSGRETPGKKTCSLVLGLGQKKSVSAE